MFKLPEIFHDWMCQRLFSRYDLNRRCISICMYHEPANSGNPLGNATKPHSHDQHVSVSVNSLGRAAQHNIECHIYDYKYFFLSFNFDKTRKINERLVKHAGNRLFIPLPTPRPKTQKRPHVYPSTLHARGVKHDTHLCAHGLRGKVARELGAHGATV